MQITFDTTTITDDEVRGIFALLDTVRPAAFDSAEVDLSALAEPIKGFNEWVGEKITKLTETDEEVSREPISATDSTGLPWDERIHASSKALNADGTWRTKRGVDKAFVASVEAELRQEPAAVIEQGLQVSGGELSVDENGAPKVAIPAPPAPPAPEAPTAHRAEGGPIAPGQPISGNEGNPKVFTPAPVAPSSAVSPFVALMKRVTTAQGAGKLTPPRVKELLESLDKKSIMDLRTDDDALASFAVLLDGEGV